MLGQQQRAARSDGGAFVDPYLIGARSTTCANAQAFPTNGANCKDSICNDPKMVLGLYIKGPNNIICRAWAERLCLGHWTVVSHGVHGGRAKVNQDCPWILSMKINVLIIPPPFLGPLFGAWILTLYSPSQLILTFHLSIKQIPTEVPVPSTASPYFLLVAITETTLFRDLFPSMWLGCLLAHSMRRWRPLLEPSPHCTPVRVSFYSPFLLRALWRLPLMMYHYSFLVIGRPRTGSSSAASLGYLVFHYLSSAIFSSTRALGLNGKWAGTQILWPHICNLILCIKYKFIYYIVNNIWFTQNLNCVLRA